MSANKVRFMIGGIAADRFYAWGRPIHAPFSGDVVRASDGWPDHLKVSLLGTACIWIQATFLFRPKVTAHDIDIRPNVGNHVMLRHSSGGVVFFAHLQSGSVRVKVGQRINEGEILGGVGNSGNSTAPHLHLNVFDQVDDLLRASVSPFVLRRYARWDGAGWVSLENRLPDKGDVVRWRPERETALSQRSGGHSAP
ncbi:MAG: M23 family metallopeptidase [Methylocella sp.]